VLLLRYALPVSRIVRLTIGDGIEGLGLTMNALAASRWVTTHVD
jgi:hypothetical protein